MQILIGIIINIVILAVVLPLFYVYIVSKARDRLEKETVSKAREEIEALVKEFNNIALSRISLLEDAIARAGKITNELNNGNISDINIKTNNDKLVNTSESVQKQNNLIEKAEETNKNTSDDNAAVSNQKKRLDIVVEDENIQTNIIPQSNNTINKQDDIKKEEVKKVNKKNNIDTSAKAIDDKAKKEAIERLRSRLDRTIKSKMSIYDKKEDKKASVPEVNNSDEDSAKNDNIIKLYKAGFSKEEIAKKLNCSITEVDIVIDLELE